MLNKDVKWWSLEARDFITRNPFIFLLENERKIGVFLTVSNTRKIGSLLRGLIELTDFIKTIIMPLADL